MERDAETGIARITINNPRRRNSYNPAMRGQMAAYLDELAADDDVKVVLLRGADGVFSSGADMNNAYGWYGERSADVVPATEEPRSVKSRPSQRRRLAVDRETFGFYHDFLGYPKATVAEVRGCALGGGPARVGAGT